MSQIFDALQRTEASRYGLDPAELTAAAELLEIAERQAVQVPIDGARQGDDQHRGNGNQTAKLDVGPWDQFPLSQVMVAPQSKLVCLTDEDSLAAEKFRFLGVRLRHLQQKQPLKRLLITSSMAEEGKSMISANLACTLARKQQQKVLLLEGDLRRPTLGEQFGLGKIPGLSELLHGQPCTAMNIRHLESLGLWILPAGSPSRTSLELIQSRTLSMLMDQFSAWFDWIVIDSPPLMPLADTSVWMRMADGFLLVTRPGKTAKRQLQRGLEAIDQAKLLGAVLNGSADVGLGEYYHYYGHATASRTTNQPA
jgi:capsular exopolysaccharide synthesis family protein